MYTFDSSNELPVWIGGLIGLVIVLVAFSLFRRNASVKADTNQREAMIGNPAYLAAFQMFAAAFIACALLQDFTIVFFPGFHVPVSAKYVMAICASAPRFLSKRRG